jgi:hypothetical protein
MTTIEVRTVVHVVSEPLWRGAVMLLAGKWVLAVLGGEVARAGERFGLSVLREIERTASLQAYDWRGAGAIAAVTVASGLGSWIAVHCVKTGLIGGASSTSRDA